MLLARPDGAPSALPSLALAAALALAACAPEDSPAPGLAPDENVSASRADGAREVPPSATITLCAFSSAREAFGAKVLPAFARCWLRKTGQELEFIQRYEGSRALADTIAGGFPADVAVFANTEHLGHLADLGLIDPEWRDAPYDGIVSRSLVVFAVREGNPKKIHDWTDLLRPGVRVVVSDPATSGIGMWSACALYGAALRGHAGVRKGDRAAALTFVRRVFASVAVTKASACESYRAFQDGAGDVAITYESEVALGWAFGHDHERVIPSSTLLVENAAVLVTANAARAGHLDAALALLRHLWTADAQTRFAASGLRPVDPAVAALFEHRFPQPQDLWTIADLGGWEAAVRDVLEPAGFAAPSPGK